MSVALNTELRRLRDEVSRLKSINQRLEFEKIQQKQKLEAAEAEKKVLEGQLHVLFQQIGADAETMDDTNNDNDDGVIWEELDKNEESVVPVTGEVCGVPPSVSVDVKNDASACAVFQIGGEIKDELVDGSIGEKASIALGTPKSSSPTLRQVEFIEVEPPVPTDFTDIDEKCSVIAEALDVPKADDNIGDQGPAGPSSVGQETNSVYIDQSISKAAFLEKLANNHVVKVNQAVMMLDADSQYELLGHLGSPIFPIASDASSESTTLTSQYVTRETVSRKFGGNIGGLIQRPADSAIRVHGYTHFLCPKLDEHPHVPQVPGAHGLILRCGLEDGIVENEEQRKVLGAPPHKVIVGFTHDRWMYMGDYEFERGEPLSSYQWSSFSRRIRDAWARMILSGKNAIKAETRASIALRKHLNREPSQDEIKCLVRTRGEIWQNVTKADVMAAYNNGEELVVPWVMKCVGYDEDFQRKLLDDETYRRAPKRASTTNINGFGSRSSPKKMKFDTVDWDLLL